MVSVGTQTDESSFMNDGSTNEYFFETHSSDGEGEKVDDYDYVCEEYENLNEKNEDEPEVGGIARKYLLVEWDHLKSLLNHCLICGREAVLTKILSKGSLIKTHLECPEHQSTWTSQSSRNGIPEGNMALCAGILLSGLTWNSFERALSIIDVQMIGRDRSITLKKSICSRL